MRAIFYLLVILGLSVSAARCEENTKEIAALQPTVEKYQKAFQMDTFKLTVHIDTNENIHKVCPANSVACSHWSGHPSTDDMEGDIYIVQTADYDPETFGLKLTAEAYQRYALVHELVHVLWEYAQEEAAVVLLVAAINP